MDPNADPDTRQARGFMNRIVTSWAGAIVAIILAIFVVVWLLG